VTDGRPPTAHVTRHRASDQIFADLQDRIVAGEFARGERLPTERELAGHYGVSANTVRESIRALSLMGLVAVRHGSGAYVTASPSGLVGNSFGMLMRFEHTGLADVVRLSAVLHDHAARLAITAATAADLAALSAAIDHIDVSEARHLGERIETFLRAFVACAHDPLLDALCSTLDHVVVAVTASIIAEDPAGLNPEIAALRPVRTAMLDALRDRDGPGLMATTTEYHARSGAIIAAHPRLRDVRLSDPRWTPLLAGLLWGTETV
jgi:GntR family transcriptional repressor for pyruvate dehydrogenase complex